MKPTILKCEDGQPFVFTLTFTPYPTPTLGQYKNIATAKNTDTVSDQDVLAQLEAMRDHHATQVDVSDTTIALAGDELSIACEDMESVESVVSGESGTVGKKLNQPFTVDGKTYTITSINRTNTTVQTGDFITFDFSGTVDGQPIDSGTAKDYPLHIGDNKFIGNFEEQLVGAKVGQTITVNLTFPENYHVPDLANKPAVFTCTINSIKRKVLPDLNDDFAKAVSKFDTLDELKIDLKRKLESEADRRATEAMHEAAVEIAANNMTVDIPPVMIEDKITELVEELEFNLTQRGISLAQYLAVNALDLGALRSSYRDIAVKAVRIDILLDEIAKIENIDVDRKEINLELQYMAAMYRTTPKQVYKILSENRQLSTLVANILRRKARRIITGSIEES